ncbi:hypothetical protein SAMN04488522_102408 [Pedobacter caeni]|uniref:Uncharacterized protein n=1 Tax=Pedobacter caeni TaxID=288992 RepID=A0A1M4ZPZ5_9SPHI|nr:hypothetical protein SAMN04488522_102408 [Pedobacter caeni]
MRNVYELKRRCGKKTKGLFPLEEIAPFIIFKPIGIYLREVNVFEVQGFCRVNPSVETFRFNLRQGIKAAGFH